jgi:hypothetical protein
LINITKALCFPGDGRSIKALVIMLKDLFKDELSGGFKFKLLDYSYPEIVFKVAWIKNDIYSKDTYEDSLTFCLHCAKI